MNILENLYYGNLCEYDRKIPPQIRPLQDKIANLYEEIKEKLSKEDFTLFEKFLDSYDDLQEKSIIDKYVRGFKTGLLIGLEAFNITF